MDALTKTASICASVYLKKNAASFASAADDISRGVEEMARRDRILKSIRGDTFPTWAKIMAGLTGGKLLLDANQNNNSRGWRS